MPVTYQAPPAAVLNPAAYGSIPVIPPTSTNTSQSTTTSVPNLPNYAALAAQASGIAGNQMAGQLNPQDLANAQTWAAQRGIATGTGFDSPNNMAAYQQFLGLSAQQLEQQGVTNYQGLLAGAPKTTTTSGSQTTDNNVLAAITAASPNPYAAAMANWYAQQAGLASGAGAATGGISGAPATHPATTTPTTSGAVGGGGGQPATPAPGTVIPGAGGGQDLTVQSNGTATDPQGNVWSMDANGNWVYAAPGGSSVVWSGQSPSEWDSYFNTGGAGTTAAGATTGANAPLWQQMGYSSEDEYNADIDQFITGGDISGGGDDSGSGYLDFFGDDDWN
jgi:hypothetical protein